MRCLRDCSQLATVPDGQRSGELPNTRGISRRHSISAQTSLVCRSISLRLPPSTQSAFAKPALSFWRTGYFARHQLDDRTMGTCSLVDSEASPRLLRKMPELILCESTPKGRRVQPCFARGKSKPPLRTRATLAFLSLSTNATTVPYVAPDCRRPYFGAHACG